MLANNFKVKLKMESDWQVGTGAGIPGGIDELVSKDVDEFPQVPAKTIVGIWRDALETLTLGLDNGNEKGSWSKRVEEIFGNQPNEKGADPTKKPVQAILSTQPARIPESLRAKIANDERLKQALTFIKVGVEIEKESGTSKDESLRFDEMGRSGTVLETEVELQRTNEIISALLILSAKLVERIGGKRRRGSGKCKIEIDGITAKQISDAVEIIRVNNPTTDKRLEIEKAKVTDEGSDWQTCEYTVMLETPVSIVTAVLGNVSESLDFIPGTYLINHFTKYCGQDIFEKIKSNDFLISPATICIEDNRSLPVPKVFAQEKMDKTKVYNRLIETLEGKEQTKPVREGFYVEKDGKILHATTPQAILMHNAVDDEVQRPTTDVVGVYSREAIKAGTILKGEIRFRKMEFDDVSKLNGKVRIGTSKKDDYGLAKIEFETPKPYAYRSVAKSRELVVYLASDVLLRNGNLRQTNLVEDLKIELEQTLGAGALKSYDKLLADAEKTLKTNPNDKNAIDFINKRKGLINSIIPVRRIESWQVGWGFPRPTLTLMQAGSVIVFDIQNFENFTETEINDFAAKLDRIEKNGIGERRGEGYGQIIFNPPLLDISNPSWEKKEASKAAPSNHIGEIEDKEFAKLIEKTAWQEELKLAVSKIAAEETNRKELFGFEIERDSNGKITKTTPSMSQIGGLRSAVMRMREFSDNKIVLDWLEHLKVTNNRLEKWDRSKNTVNAKRKIDDKLIPIFKNFEKIWLILCETEIEDVKAWKSPKTLVRTKEQMQSELWAKAVRSLFYACQHAHKRDTEKEVKNNGEEN